MKLYSSSIPFWIKVLQTFFVATTLLAYTNMNTIIRDNKECNEKYCFFKELKYFIYNPQVEKIQYYYVDFVFMIGLAGWFYTLLLLVNKIKSQGKFINSLLIILIVLGLSSDLYENCKLVYIICTTKKDIIITIPYFDFVPVKIYFSKYLFPFSFIVFYLLIYMKSRFWKQTGVIN